MLNTLDVAAGPAGSDDIIMSLASACRIPIDDPGVHEFARMVARYCAALAESSPATGDAAHVSQLQAQAVGSEIGATIKAHFECD